MFAYPLDKSWNFFETGQLGNTWMFDTSRPKHGQALGVGASSSPGIWGALYYGVGGEVVAEAKLQRHQQQAFLDLQPDLGY